jgi:hypothetical protein
VSGRLLVPAVLFGCLLSGRGNAATVDAPLSAGQVIQLLDQTVDWYRSFHFDTQTVDEPSDELVLGDNERIAGQVLASAFALGKADAQLLASTAGSTSAPPVSDAGGLAHLQETLSRQTERLKTDIAAERAAEGGVRDEQQRSTLAAKLAAQESALSLLDARAALVTTVINSSSERNGGDLGPGALEAQIDAMAASLPTQPTAAGGASKPTAGATAQPKSSKAASGATAGLGLWQDISKTFSLVEKMMLPIAAPPHCKANSRKFAIPWSHNSRPWPRAATACSRDCNKTTHRPWRKSPASMQISLRSSNSSRASSNPWPSPCSCSASIGAALPTGAPQRSPSITGRWPPWDFDSESSHWSPSYCSAGRSSGNARSCAMCPMSATVNNCCCCGGFCCGRWSARSSLSRLRANSARSSRSPA